LIEAGAVKGRALTSWPSLRTDLVNAGSFDRAILRSSSRSTLIK